MTAWLTDLKNKTIVNLPLQQVRVGFGRPVNRGTGYVPRQVHGFFYALHACVLNAVLVMVGVLGGLRACRFHDPVDQPDTSAAQGLVAPVGGFEATIVEMPS